MKIKVLMGIFLALFAASPVHAYGWRAETKRDRFTDIETCRITPGSEMSRAIIGGLLDMYAPNYFFVERRGQELRAGVTNDRSLPIPYEVQVRVDQNPAETITAADTPVDSAPKYTMPATPNLTPEMRASVEASMKSIYAISSPYRVFAGEKARALISEIAAGHVAKWRFVGINVTSDRAIDIPTKGFSEALSKCGINPAIVPPS